MRLRRRRRRAAAIVDASWFWVNREAAYEMAAEMATWPEPIDVIREAFGLPDRWQRAIGRAWQAVLKSAASQIPLITATDAEAGRMARLMLSSEAIRRGSGPGAPWQSRRKRRL